MMAMLENAGAVQDCTSLSVAMEQLAFEEFTLLFRSIYCAVTLAGASIFDVIYGAAPVDMDNGEYGRSAATLVAVSLVQCGVMVILMLAF